MIQRRATPLLLCAAGLLCLLAASGVAQADPQGQQQCGQHDDDAELRVDRLAFPVTLSDGNSYTVVGYLYHEGRSAHACTLQVVVHGATYDHQYWDMPSIGGHDYSYARYMADHGYDVLALDLPGAGESSKPDGDFFGLDEAASSLHQVVASLRTYSNPAGRGFGSIALVGHSNGSVTAIYAQGTYADADALVTTGWVHGCRGLPVDPTDPLLGAALGTPYVSLPGFVRSSLFYYAPFADPDVIAYDNASLVNSMPRHQFLDLLGVHGDITARCSDGTATTLTRSQLVTEPVLVQAGEYDLAIAPAGIVNNAPTEASFYSASSSVTVQVLPDIGHSFNGHTTNHQGWTQIDGWLRQTLAHP
jgi:pimeloyl-ACP methyl ester carboxylesterase